jgi:hypothetical protein
LGPRFYLSSKCVDSFGNGGGIFTAIKILGGSIEFTTDVSKLGCGTNAAFYLVSMPSTSLGQANDYYCDANCVGGNCCPEMDLLEANRWAIAISPHHCSSATSGCDGGGCGKNAKDISSGYGPGSSYKINTDKPYTVKISFAGSTSSGTLTGITSVITQGTNSITMTHGSECGSNISNMGKWLNAGMVPVWSYWSSGSMGWLDGHACSPAQDANPEVKGNWIFSNLKIQGTQGTATGPPPPPPPPPGSIICGTKGMNNNNWWLEFTVSSSAVPNPAGTTAKVTNCPGVASYTCTWFASGKKYQCSLTNGCSAPVITVGTKPCALDANVQYAVSDMTATSDVSSDQPLIIGLSAGIAVAIIVIVVLIVVVVMKKNNANFIETA